MDQVNGVSGNESYMEQLKALQEKQKVDRGESGEKITGQTELAQEDFLSLLTKQLSHQDPFKPVDNQQMISQMASFATVNGIGQMNEHFDSLNSAMTSNQALQASSLVGQDVLVPSNQGYKSEFGDLSFIAKFPQALNNVIVKIHNSSGELLKTINLGQQSAGNQKIAWDGKDENGKLMPEGNYQLSASGNIDGKTQHFEIATFANVNSVLFGNGDGNVMLNIAGSALPIKLSEVLEIGKANSDNQSES